MTDGLWRKDGAKDEKPKTKYNFNHEAPKPPPSLFPAPNGLMYENSTAYYRSLNKD